MIKVVFVNINEEGEEYDRFDNLMDAVRMNAEFPNDTIEIRLEET